MINELTPKQMNYEDKGTEKMDMIQDEGGKVCSHTPQPVSPTQTTPECVEAEWKRDKYLERQGWADRFYSDIRRTDFGYHFNERDLFLEFIDKAIEQGASSQKSSLIKEIEGMKKDKKPFDSCQIVDGYNQAIDEVIAKLK